LAEAAKPDKFKKSTKWEDWKPTFLNYIQAMLGRGSIPLMYICCQNNQPSIVTNKDFLDDYIDRALFAYKHINVTSTNAIAGTNIKFSNPLTVGNDIDVTRNIISNLEAI
jgi:hypothetical protein